MVELFDLAPIELGNYLNYCLCCYYYFGCPFERPCIYFVLYATMIIRIAVIVKVTMNLGRSCPGYSKMMPSKETAEFKFNELKKKLEIFNWLVIKPQ